MQVEFVIRKFFFHEASHFLSIYERTVLLFLADCCRDKNVCFPKQETIAQKCNFSICEIKRCVKSLQKKSVIKIEKKWKLNYYFINIELIDQLMSAEKQHDKPSSSIKSIPEEPIKYRIDTLSSIKSIPDQVSIGYSTIELTKEELTKEEIVVDIDSCDDQKQTTTNSYSVNPENIQKLYKHYLPDNPQIFKWTADMTKSLNDRIRGSPERKDIRWWQEFVFERIANSKYLTGLAKKKFYANIWTILNEKYLINILNGLYD